MDSLTQIALGAAIGASIGGKNYGRKALLIGGICGTIPDLDVLFSFGKDPVTTFTYHRGFSHSFLFAILATPCIAWLFSKIAWFKVSFKDKRLHWIIFLALLTHMLLDAITIYGTQLLWPSALPPAGLGSVFIIDLLYTLPLLIGTGWFLFKKSPKATHIALTISSLYLIWGIGVQHYIKSIFYENYKKPFNHVLVQTTPFNSLLWRIVVMDDGGYKIGYYSIFDKNKDIKFKKFPLQNQYLKPIQDSKSVKRLKWFTKGFYTVGLRDNNIIMTDIRMGLEPDNYIFGFIVGKKDESGTTAITPLRYSNSRDMSALSKIWARIWDENIEI